MIPFWPKDAPPPPPPPAGVDALLGMRPLYTQEGCAASAYPFLFATVAFTLLVTLWERYLDWRQHKRVAEKGLEIPAELETLVAQISTEPTKDAKEGESTPAALLEKLREKAPAAQAYALDKSRFKFVASAYSLTKALAFVLLGGLPYFWDLADAIGDRYFPGDNEIRVSLVFFALWEALDTVLGLPVSLYSTFVIEEKHGFNKSSVGLFFADMAKTLALEAVLGAPCMALFLKIVMAAGPQNLALYVGSFFFVVAFLFITIYPVLIQPLFNKYEPLEAGPLREAIEALAKSVDYPLYKLFTVDGSKRSGHSNAYMFGFFKSKRIVLFDTLIKQMSTEEIVAVLAHELGHWRFGHVLLNFCVSQAYIFLAFSLFARVMGSADVYSAFGFAAAAGASPTAGAPVIVGVLLFFAFLFEPVDHTISFFMTWNSRRCEFEADAYAASLGKAAPLQRGLVKITFENLGVLDPDPWFSTYHHSHPPLVQRLRGIEAAAKKAV
eukprot:CAMPEP_0119271330 /NCGR_PEP_ID=MMETSP1329-20130426/7964_1 /TAXON_ID=114041 /ORGANISM="Genus nov. species nov., Strain RCC1024" /LENGTH=495 /DNA_ID=CAMNT_0007271377 /DNA_START=170 /DNA_END=1657 /DNA_ORIENTATION=-